MNRTILIVICDFLLVSLLAFSTVDINKTTEKTQPSWNGTTTAPAQTNRIGGRQDLGDVMRLALEEEKKRHDALSLELSNAQSTASAQRMLLNQRDQRLQAVEDQLRSQAAQASQLQQQVGSAQSNIATLNQQLQASTTETVIAREQRAAQEAAVRNEMEKVAALQRKLAALESSNQVALAERAQLASQLQLTQAQKEAAAAALARTEQDLQVQRQQNTQLAEGVKALAGKSSELVQEIRENRTLTPNTIFNDFVTNRVAVSFEGVRPGFFGGDAVKQKQTQTIMVTDGTNTYALCHLQDTLLELWTPGTPWKDLNGTLSHGSDFTPVTAFSFYVPDPRVVLMPVPAAWAAKSGCKVYHVAKDPFKFQDAVVVGAREGYYGECQFQMDLSTPKYLKMDHNSIKGLFGKFNPSTGDLVFSRTGDLLGVMVNNTYCAVVQDFSAVDTVHFGKEKPQEVADTLSSLYAMVVGMPFKLQ
jgi:hypothetical protein